MHLSFKNFMGSFPTSRRAESGVTEVGVSIKKSDRSKLSTSEKLKLSKSARKKGGGVR